MRRALLLLISLATLASASDWPQWRGPLRNGVAPDSTPLIDRIPDTGLKELWESEPIPADDKGGLSSPVVAAERVFVALVWHREVPTESRQIDDKALLQLGFQDTSNLSAELLKKIEDTRGELPPNLRGRKLEEFTQNFADTNFD